jgi:hypothetical protein
MLTFNSDTVLCGQLWDPTVLYLKLVALYVSVLSF